MLTIRCAKCKAKIFRYLKIGKGRLLHCWKDRIKKDFSIHNGDTITCQCGNIIGRDEGKWIKMKQHTFVYSGTKM
jgi:hypothetical protein